MDHSKNITTTYTPKCKSMKLPFYFLSILLMACIAYIGLAVDPAQICRQAAIRQSDFDYKLCVAGLQSFRGISNATPKQTSIMAATFTIEAAQYAEYAAHKLKGTELDIAALLEACESKYYSVEKFVIDTIDDLKKGMVGEAIKNLNLAMDISQECLDLFSQSRKQIPETLNPYSVRDMARVTIGIVNFVYGTG